MVVAVPLDYIQNELLASAVQGVEQGQYLVGGAVRRVDVQAVGEREAAMTTILKGNILHAPAFGALKTVPEGCMVLEDGKIQGIYPVLPERYAACPVTTVYQTPPPRARGNIGHSAPGPGVLWW